MAKKEKLIKPQINQILYDDQGYRIGDDGFPMTKPRKNLHTILNFILVGGYICIISAVVCVLAAFFQNQSFTPTEFIYYGGNEYNGYSIGNLLRIEALSIFLIGLLAIALSHRCFNWLYDNGRKDILPKYYLAISAVTIMWNAYLIFFVRLFDPLSILITTFVLLMLLFMRNVETERKTLKPSKIAR